jgi:hypothetical protein
MNPNRTRMIVSLAVVVLLAISSLPAIVAATENGGDSPEQVFERMRAAVISNDRKEMAACLSPQGRAEMSGMMVMVASMVAAFSQMGAEMSGEMAEAVGATEQAPPPTEDIAANLEALLARHGLDEAALGPPGTPMENPPKELESPELLADLMTFVDELPSDDEDDAGPGSPEGFSVPEGDLENLKVKGDQATAKIGDEPAKFVRVDGRWYIDPDLGIGSGDGS